MNSVFICTKEGCPNCNIEYVMEGDIKKAQCGGCGKMLKQSSTVEAVAFEEAPIASA